MGYPGRRPRTLEVPQDPAEPGGIKLSGGDPYSGPRGTWGEAALRTRVGPGTPPGGHAWHFARVAGGHQPGCRGAWGSWWPPSTPELFGHLVVPKGVDFVGDLFEGPSGDSGDPPHHGRGYLDIHGSRGPGLAPGNKGSWGKDGELLHVAEPTETAMDMGAPLTLKDRSGIWAPAALDRPALHGILGAGRPGAAPAQILRLAVQMNLHGAVNGLTPRSASTSMWRTNLGASWWGLLPTPPRRMWKGPGRPAVVMAGTRHAFPTVLEGWPGLLGRTWNPGLNAPRSVVIHGHF